MPSINYGQFYWCVKVTTDISGDGEIYLMADDVRVVEGALEFVRITNSDDAKNRVNFLLPPGKWLAVYSASLLDGSAVAVEYWADEVIGPGDGASGKEPSQAKIIGAPTKPGPPRRMSNSLRYLIMERDRFTCKVCGRTENDGVKLEIDHIIPVSAGGRTELDNLRTLCYDCNRGKGDKLPAA